MRAMLVLLICMPMSGAAAANEACLKVDNDLDRLACYDRESGRASVIKNLPATKGKWVVQEEVSKLTDKVDVFLRLSSERPVQCGWNRSGQAELLVMCRDNTTAMVFMTGCHMASGHGDYGTVTYRVGDTKAKSVAMDASTDNKSLGLWSGGQAIPVLKSMLGETKLVARMTPYGDNPIMLEFDVSGLDVAIKPLRTQCKW